MVVFPLSVFAVVLPGGCSSPGVCFCSAQRPHWPNPPSAKSWAQCAIRAAPSSRARKLRWSTPAPRATRTAVTDASGSYAFKNIDVGSYTLTLTAPGFEKESLPAIALTARETRRMDATLKPGAETQTVVVMDDAAPVITTDVSNLAETKAGDELVALPVAIYSRSTGSTSPISTLTTESGVQTDDSGNLAVDGTTAALLSVTIDGISSVGVEYSGPVNEMFPSFNSIEEIRVSESNNGAEFGGVADITTVSKAGTNHYHGGVVRVQREHGLQLQQYFRSLQTEDHHERLRRNARRPTDDSASVQRERQYLLLHQL